MTSTTTEDFTAVLNLTADPATVAALFTSVDGVSRWWGPTEGEATVGGSLATSFGEHGVNAVRVVEATPTRVVWESIRPEGGVAPEDEWLGTTMEFDFIPAGSGTEFRFRHHGLTPQLRCWDDCVGGWTHYLASIEACAETGTGMPFGS